MADHESMGIAAGSDAARLQLTAMLRDVTKGSVAAQVGYG